MRRFKIPLLLGAIPVLVIVILGCADDSQNPEGTIDDGPRVLYVAPDSTGDYVNIQSAVDSAKNGEIVELGDGTYFGEGNRDVEVVNKAITIRSRSREPESCIVDCQGVESETHRAFHFHSQDSCDVRLEGVTIKNGYADGQDWPDCNGGAVLVSGKCSPHITNCTFWKNTVWG